MALRLLIDAIASFDQFGNRLRSGTVLRIRKLRNPEAGPTADQIWKLVSASSTSASLMALRTLS